MNTRADMGSARAAMGSREKAVMSLGSQAVSARKTKQFVTIVLVKHVIIIIIIIIIITIIMKIKKSTDCNVHDP